VPNLLTSRSSGEYNALCFRSKDVFRDEAMSVCVQCGAAIRSTDKQRKFCSFSCAASFNNKGIVRNGTKRYRLTQCLRCGTLLTGCCRIYCSRACASACRADQFREKLVSNSPEIGYGSPGSVRRHLIELRGERCEQCGWNSRHPVTDRVPLEVDHMDGNYKNNRFDNLKLLCPNCHSLTPTFRNLNKGNGRSHRQKTPA
jgi:hypothetical protein